MRIRFLLLTLIAAVSISMIAACSGKKGTPAASPQPSITKEGPSSSAPSTAEDLLIYKDVSLALGNEEHVVFGTSRAEPYVVKSNFDADLGACCLAGGEMRLYFESQDREAYQAFDAQSRQDCVDSEKSATHIAGSIAFSNLKVGQQFCVLNHAYSDPKENDVDLVTVQNVSPDTGVIRLSLTGWGD